MIANQLKCEVEDVLAHQFVKHGPTTCLEYFSRWKDLQEEENSWERKESLWKYEDKLYEFEQVHGLPLRRKKRDR